MLVMWVCMAVCRLSPSRVLLSVMAAALAAAGQTLSCLPAHAGSSCAPPLVQRLPHGLVGHAHHVLHGQACCDLHGFDPPGAEALVLI